VVIVQENDMEQEDDMEQDWTHVILRSEATKDPQPGEPCGSQGWAHTVPAALPPLRGEILRSLENAPSE
jgi:hypothetical protein